MADLVSRLAPALYLVSGVAALMLEVAWFRMLGLQLGHTTGATSTVLAAFMGGLAAGSWIGGRFVGRLDHRGAWRAFAITEAAVGMSAWLMPDLLRLADPVLAHFYANGDGGASFIAARALVAALGLALPTTAMGASFPLLTRALGTADGRRHAVDGAGLLYVANTFGASTGAVLAGYVLLPGIGVRGTTMVAAALNVAVAATAAFGARGTARGNQEGGGDRRAVGGPTLAGPRPWGATALLATTVLGAVSLGSQVVWTRVLALLVGPTTYAFSALLAIAIVGLAVGAAVGRRLPHGPSSLGLAMGGVAVALLVAVACVDPLALWMASTASTPTSFATVLARQGLVAAVLIGPCSVVLGAAFPLALATAGAGRDAARVAAVYTANTIGGIVGALLAGFILVPRFGLQATLLTAAAAAGLPGVLLLWRSARQWHGQALAAVVLASVATLSMTARWTPDVLASGLYRFAPGDGQHDLRAMLTAGDTLFRREGAAATVVVRRLAGTTSLVIDGKPDASDAGDMLTQKLLGHLPLLLHERPRRVGVIGLGSGVTVGAALRHPIESIEVVEISPDVVAATAHFADLHGHALDDPRTRLIVGDARSHLRFTRATYDVIVSEPSNPWMAGVASLFTTEFMQSVRARLAPGGIFCQWAHTYDMSEADLRSILATVRGVFPRASLWLVGEADLLIVAGLDAAPDPSRIARHWARPGVADDLAAVAVANPRDISDLYAGGSSDVARLAEAAIAQDDDRLALEFTAPRSFAARAGRENVAMILSGAPPTAGRSPLAWASRGAMLGRAEAWPMAFEALRSAVRGGVDDEATLQAFTRAAAASGRVADALAVLREPHVTGDPAAVSRRAAALASLLVAGGDPQGGLAVLAAVPHRDATIQRAAAGIFADLGDVETLRALVADLQGSAPEHPDTAYFAANAAWLSGDAAGAEDLASRGLARHAADARLYNLRGVVRATQGRRPEARADFAAARRLDPRQVGTWVNSARVEQEDGRAGDAARFYAVAVALDPTSDAARQASDSVPPPR